MPPLAAEQFRGQLYELREQKSQLRAELSERILQVLPKKKRAERCDRYRRRRSEKATYQTAEQTGTRFFTRAWVEETYTHTSLVTDTAVKDEKDELRAKPDSRVSHFDLHNKGGGMCGMHSRGSWTPEDEVAFFTAALETVDLIEAAQPSKHTPITAKLASVACR